MYFLISKAIHGVTEINTKLKIENLVLRNRRNVKTHNLISGIKSEGTYGYVPDYTNPLTCIGWIYFYQELSCMSEHPSWQQKP